MNYDVRILSPHEIEAGIECFAQAIARHWPNSVDEAKSWVYEEFHHPCAVVFGAFDEKKLVGSCSLIPCEFVFYKLATDESVLVKSALRDISMESDVSRVMHVGGLGVYKDYEGRGIAMSLLQASEIEAKKSGYKILVGHTARPATHYGSIRALSLLLSYGMLELPLGQKLFYPIPSDLEKVWLYKKIF